jgi:hypothetical protein
MHSTPAAHVDLGSLAHAVSLRPDVITWGKRRKACAASGFETARYDPPPDAMPLTGNIAVRGQLYFTDAKRVP